jgi:hypothetical protein
MIESSEGGTMGSGADHAHINARRVILFSGHMIDAPGRAKARFPPSLEPRVASAVRETLAELDAGAGDLGISSAACGGDILFDEAALERSVPLRLYLPFEEDTFLQKSVEFADSDWPHRYRAVVSRAELFIAPRELGPLLKDVDPYERTNLWMLGEARRIAGDKLTFICVWDGEAGDGPGGTKHMMSAVREAGGAVHWIDIRRV